MRAINIVGMHPNIFQFLSLYFFHLFANRYFLYSPYHIFIFVWIVYISILAYIFIIYLFYFIIYFTLFYLLLVSY